MTNHELAHRYEAKSKILGKGEFKLRYLDEDKVELIEVLDKESTGRLIIPSFITGCVNDTIMDAPLYKCSYNEVYVDNRDDISFDASNLCKRMEPYGKKLKLEFRNPQKVTRLDYTFESVGGQIDSIEVNVGKNVRSMIGTFYFCRNIRSIEIKGSSIDSLITMRYAFTGCESMVELDLSTIRVPKLIDMEGMFENCSRLVRVKLPKISKSAEVHNLFLRCKEIEEIDMGGIDISKVDKYGYMLGYCYKLNKIEVGKLSYELLSAIINNGVKEIIVHDKTNYMDLFAIKMMWQTENINVEYKGEDE